MKKYLIAAVAVGAISGCSDHADQKRSIVECMSAAEMAVVDDIQAHVIMAHSELIQHQLHFELTREESKDLRKQILADWQVNSLSDDQRRAKGVAVLQTPKCKAMQR